MSKSKSKPNSATSPNLNIGLDLVYVCELYAKKVDARGFKKDPVAATVNYWRSIGNYPEMARLYLRAKQQQAAFAELMDDII